MIYQPPVEPFLDVVYSDDDVLVLNKPSGLLSVPGRQEIHKDSLQIRAQVQFPSATTVHRLDMETSGLMVMALNKPAHVHLSRQFEQRKVEKVYLARVYGLLSDDAGLIDAPLICDWPNRPKQKVDSEKGKQALTLWQVLERGKQTTLIQLKPVTGRSHQLRVHMLCIGHPILGDALYATGKALNMADRLLLHSQNLSIIHPQSLKAMHFTSSGEFMTSN